MCLNTAILFDEVANDEADRHARMMQDQRDGCDAETQDEEKPQSVGADGVYFSFKTTRDK